jgi:hypothetical protein
MKKIILLPLMVLGIVSCAFAQNNSKNMLYSVGIGLGTENNVGNYGLFLTNDLKISLAERLALNPRLSFFQSLRGFEDPEQFGYSNHSGLFIDLGLSYSLIAKEGFNFSVNVGPSTEIGSETYSSIRVYENGVLVDEVYEANKLRQFGFYADLEFAWIKDNCVHALAIKSNYYGIYPEFFGIAYKFGLPIKK